MKSRFERLQRLRAPDEDRIAGTLYEAYEIVPGDNTRYMLGAMRAVDARYTKRLIEQGNRVENQLKSRLSNDYPRLEFRRQGSVSNNTHIRYHSDVDVLTIIDKFVTLEPPQQASVPYRGDPIRDLLNLRERCVSELTQAFHAAKVDNSGATAITLSGGSLACDVDVVPANWYDTVRFWETRLEHFRGIQVLNRDDMVRVRNLPFLFNYRLRERDVQFSGRCTMLIRLLKTLKADAEEEGKEISMSSFDICSVVYRMPDDRIGGSDLRRPVGLLLQLMTWMLAIAQNSDLRQSLMVVDDSRRIFDSSSKLSGFTALFQEVITLYQGVSAEQAGREFISEAHVS